MSKVGKPWSKLKARVEDLFVPSLDIRIHCTKYRYYTNHDHYDVPRHYIMMAGEVIWDFPGPYLRSKGNPYAPPIDYQWGFANGVASVLRQYLDCPKDKLLETQFEEDHWFLGDMLRAADRRLGFKRLTVWAMMMDTPNPAKPVLLARFARVPEDEGQSTTSAGTR